MSFGNSNTETRILQMQLDNKDFEDGVRQTIQSLENLEEKLNLKNVENGFDKVSTAANSVQMSHLENGLDTVTSKFTLMGQIGLQALERISSKVVNLGERLIREATVQPMIDGWGEFEMKTNSVQTILGGIRNQFDDQPTAIAAISVALDELNDYADKTIYSFAQMTDNVGKFTNQGLGLEESTNAIKGIANWAAAVGATPEQMSRAMYNISQSLGAGSMQLIDWKSIRFANMATPEVKNLFIEVAKRMGTVDKNGNVIKGKQTFNVFDDFEASLKANAQGTGGWLTNEVMAEAFQIYAKSFTQEELIARYGKELGTQFYEMGSYAEEAATKVRTFSQLIGVLKESLGSGWANTFDILFGGFEKQTEFLTAIKERFEEIINFQTDDRNTFLQNFSDIGGIETFQNIILTTIDILKDFYWVFNDVIGITLNPFADTSDSVFGPRQEGYENMLTTWESTKAVFDDISNTLTKFRTWLNTSDKKSGKSPLQSLANALSGITGAAGIVMKVLGGIGKLATRLFGRFKPLISSVLDLFGQIGATVYNLFYNLTGQQSIEKIFDGIGDAIEPVVDFVVSLSTAVVNLIHNLLGIDSAADDWTVLGNRLSSFFDILSYDPELTFFENLKNSARSLIISIFGADLAASMTEAWNTNIAPIFEPIRATIEGAFGDLSRFFNGLSAALGADYSKTDNAAKTFLQAFFSGFYGEDKSGADAAYENVLGIYQQIKEYYDQNVAPNVKALNEIFTVKLPSLNEKIKTFLFGSDTTVMTGPGQSKNQHKNGLIDSLVAMFSADNLTEALTSVNTFFDPIIKEFEDAWHKFIAFFTGEDVEVLDNGRWRQGHNTGLFEIIQGFFDGTSWDEILASIQTFFDPVVKGFEDAWGKLNEFLFGSDATVMTGPGQSKNQHKNGLLDNLLAAFGIDSTWKQTWDTIEQAFSGAVSWITSDGNPAWGIIMDFLFGPEETMNLNGPGQAQTVRTGGIYQEAMNFLTPVWEWIQTTLQPLYNYIIGHDFTEMWRGLNDLLFGYDTVVMAGPGQDKTVHTDGLLEPIMTVLKPIADVFNQIKGWALEKLSGINWEGIWGSLDKFFNGYDEVVVSEGSDMTVSRLHRNGVFESIAAFFERVIAFFETPEVQAFIGKVKEVLGWVAGLGGELFGAISDLFGGKGFVGFEKVGTYLTGGIDKLLPEGLSLGGILGALLGGNNGENGKDTGGKVDEKDVENAVEQSGWFNTNPVLRLIVSKADAAEADANALANAFDGYVVSLDSAAGSTEKSATEGTAATSSILGSISKLLPYIGGATAIGLVSKVSDMITGITGNRKPTILEQIASLLTAIGQPLIGLGTALAGAAIAEKIAPGTVDKVFGHLTSLLTTLFTWVAAIAGGGTLLSSITNVGGSALMKKTFGGASGSKVAESLNFDSASSIISSLGEGISGLFGGLQTMYNLVLELMAADFIMGFDEKGVANFDKRLDRVLGLVGKVLMSILGSQALTSFIDVVSKIIVGGVGNMLGKDLQTESIYKTLAGLGAFVSAVGDGIAAILTASIVPNILNIDTSKIVDVINAVFTGLGALATITELGTLTSLLGNSSGWEAFKALAGTGGGLAVALGAIGTVAGFLIDWYAGIVSDRITDLAPSLYTFMSNLTGALQMIASLGETQLGSAEAILSTDLPRLLGYISPEKLGYNKETLNDVGTTIRDFGNRVNAGISTLARAKDVYDKYSANGDDRQFPLDFFQSMTEALGYLQGDGIKELYDSVFGQNGYFVGKSRNEEQNIDGLNRFFSTIGSLGYVITQYSEYDGISQSTGTKLESTKEGLDAFQDAFSGIQGSFHLLIDDISKETFKTEKIDALANFLTTIATAGDTFTKSFYYEHGNLKVFESTSPITKFAGWLQTMGTGVRQLNDSLTNNKGEYDIDYNQLESALKALQPMAEIEKTIYEYSKLSKGDEWSPSSDWDFMENTSKWIDEVLPRMQSIGSNLHAMAAEISPEDTAALTSASGTLTSLSSFISQDFYTNLQTMSTEQIGSYAEAFGNLKESLLMDNGSSESVATTIQQIFDQIGDKEVKLKITPVISDTSFQTVMNLPENMLLNSNYSRNINLQVNMTDVQNVRVDPLQIASLVSANNETGRKITTLASNIDGIATAVRDIKIYLDTGVLAGAVDDYLGYSAFLASRTGG